MKFSDLVPILVPIIGIALAAVFAFWRQSLVFKAERRDRLRHAYSDWLTALDRYQDSVIVDEKYSSNEEKSQISALHIAEVAAFSYVLLLDPNEERIKRAKRIREDEWWDQNRISNQEQEGSDLHIKIRNSQLESIKSRHKFTRYLCKELKESV